MSILHAFAIMAGFYVLFAIMADGGLVVLGWIIALIGPVCILLGLFGPALGIGH